MVTAQHHGRRAACVGVAPGQNERINYPRRVRYVVIMAGGSGTRLWPLSRKGTPKQLLRLIDGKSLLRLAFERACELVAPERVLVVTGASYLDQVAEDLPEAKAENLLGEPEGRDSLNACAWAAAVLADRDPEAVIAQLTADQLIEPLDVFVASVDAAFQVAEADADALVTLGVVPTCAHTGYGYLQRGEALPGGQGACRVVRFKEKPDAETAQAYLDSGEYWWNAGMFVWRAATFMKQLSLLAPANHAGIERVVAEPQRLAELFGLLPKTSVDYAIMEPVSTGQGSAHVVAVPLPVEWRDVGGYESLAEIFPVDEQGNAVVGRALALDAARNVVFDQRGTGHLVALLGVSDLVVVETPGATLVASRDRAEQVKALVARLAHDAPEFA